MKRTDGSCLSGLIMAGLIAVSLLAANPALAERGGVLTLEDCIGIALKNNPDIGVAEEGVRRSEKNLLSNYGRLLPNFTASFSTGHAFYGPSSIQYDAQGRPVQMDGFDYEAYSFGMTSSISLFDGGATINRIRSSMWSRDGAREDLSYSKNIVSAMVIRAYYNLVRNQMLLHVAEESEEQAKRNLDRTEAILEVGSATRADVLKAKVRHSNTKLGLIRAKNAVELAREDLIAVLNMDEDRDVAVDTSMVIDYIDPNIDAEIQHAFTNRSDLRGLGYSLKSAQAEIAAARSGWLPQIAAQFSYGWNDRQMADNLNFFKEEYTWWVGASLSLNIFDRFATNSNVGIAKANHRVAEYSLEKAKLDAVREIKGLGFSLKEARERIAVATETVEQAMEDLRLAEERYRVGAGTMLETIDAQVALTQAKADVIDAKCDYLIAKADLSRATGKKVRR